MEDEKKEEETKPVPNMLEQAELLAKRIEEANKRTEELIARQEKLESERILGGRATAGQAQEKPKEETPQEYAARVLKGEANPFKVQ